MTTTECLPDEPEPGSEQIQGDVLLRWGHRCIDDLNSHRAEINDLNVFPVADSDTGTNLCATLRAAVERAVDDLGGFGAGASAHRVASALAQGAGEGARGNSGLIVSQVLLGFAEAVASGPLTAAGLTRALRRAAARARGAMSEPVEGTIVTVLAAAARAAECAAATSPAEVATVAADAAAEAVRQTMGQLSVLRTAGVVDAGGRGVSVMLDALVAVTTGIPPQRAPFAGTPSAVVGQIPAVGADHGFEVMYAVCDTDPTRVGRLREQLVELGDSVILAEDGVGTWRIHVHCRDAGAAVDAGLTAGRLRGVRISCFTAESAPGMPSGLGDRGILAITSGEGAAKLFEAEGATVLSGDDPVTAAELLRAVRAMPHREVMVLPNGALPTHELIAVAAAARGPDREVLVLPGASVVQGLAAMAVHDPGRAAVDDAFAMSEAVAGTRWGLLRIAGERALTLAGVCRQGDVVGMASHEVVVIESDVGRAAATLADRLLAAGGELVTLLVGADASEGPVDSVRDHIARNHPGVEVSVYFGGQHGDLLHIGVE